MAEGGTPATSINVAVSDKRKKELGNNPDKLTLNLGTVELGCGLTVRITSFDMWRILEKCSVQRIKTEDRNSLMANLKLATDQEFITDVYSMNGPKFTGQEDVHVNLKVNMTRRGDTNFYQFFVKVKNGKNWENQPATYEEGKLHFKVRLMEAFVGVLDYPVQREVISPNGTTILASVDNRIKVIFPEKSVKSAEKMTFKIIHIDLDYVDKIKANSPKSFSDFLFLGDGISVGHDKSNSFDKPVSVYLPSGKADSILEKESELTVMRVCDGKCEIFDVLETCGDGLCKIDVNSFSIYHSFRRRKRGAMPSLDAEIIQLQYELLTKQIFKCNIVIYKELTDTYTKIWIDIVNKADIDTVTKQRRDMGLEEIPNCRSSDIYLRNMHKIRVDTLGCIRPLQNIPKSYFNMTFMPCSEDNHIAFPVKEHTSLHNCPNGEIHFYMSSGRRKNECFHIVSYSKASLMSKKGKRGNLYNKPIVVQERNYEQRSSRSSVSSECTDTSSVNPSDHLKDDRTSKWVTDQNASGVHDRRKTSSCSSNQDPQENFQEESVDNEDSGNGTANHSSSHTSAIQSAFSDKNLREKDDNNPNSESPKGISKEHSTVNEGHHSPVEDEWHSTPTISDGDIDVSIRSQRQTLSTGAISVDTEEDVPAPKHEGLETDKVADISRMNSPSEQTNTFTSSQENKDKEVQVLSDASLLHLAKKIEPDVAVYLGINLGISNDEIDQLEQKYGVKSVRFTSNVLYKIVKKLGKSNSTTEKIIGGLTNEGKMQQAEAMRIAHATNRDMTHADFYHL